MILKIFDQLNTRLLPRPGAKKWKSNLLANSFFVRLVAFPEQCETTKGAFSIESWYALVKIAQVVYKSVQAKCYKLLKVFSKVCKFTSNKQNFAVSLINLHIFISTWGNFY